MQLVRDLSAVPAGLAGAVLAIGNFDGLHRGHRLILEAALERARALGVPAAVMTFEPHPREFFKPDAPRLRLMRLREKLAGLRALGFDAVFLPRFNAALAATTAEDFVRGLLVEKLAVQEIVTGEDFCFGAKRGGNCAFLAQAAQDHGFAYHAMPHLMEGGEVISSTAVREHLSRGELADAARLLGHEYNICGHVVHGDKKGRTIGVPTANMCMQNLFLPRTGVYKVRIEGLGEGVANIGLRPTVGGLDPRLEVHIFNCHDDLYGRYLRVTPLRFIRDERTFESLDVLREQIIRDMMEART